MTATRLKQRIRAYRKVQALWKQACEYEGIEPAVKFMCWSEDNPYYEAYNKAVVKYFALGVFVQGLEFSKLPSDRV